MGPKQFCTMLTLVGWGLKCHEPCISDHVMKFLMLQVQGMIALNQWRDVLVEECLSSMTTSVMSKAIQQVANSLAKF